MTQKRTALVTGGNRGIGLECARQLAEHGLNVIITSRDKKAGEKAAASLAPHKVRVEQLDVADPASISALQKRLADVQVDVLVNNAGVMLDSRKGGTDSVFSVPFDMLNTTMVTNAFGPLLLCQAFVPRMCERKYGRIVNVSSGMGQLSDMNGGSAAYRMSKTALNALTRIVAYETRGDNVLVNSVCPGWVRTDMGGANASRTVETGADTIVWAALLRDDGPTGSFFRDKRRLDW